MSLFPRQPHTNPLTGKVELRDLAFGQALEYYFDKYGCRRVGPPERYSNPEILAQASLFEPSPTLNTPLEAWPIVKLALQKNDAPDPGHIRLLPKFSGGLTALALRYAR